MEKCQQCVRAESYSTQRERSVVPNIDKERTGIQTLFCPHKALYALKKTIPPLIKRIYVKNKNKQTKTKQTQKINPVVLNLALRDVTWLANI